MGRNIMIKLELLMWDLQKDWYFIGIDLEMSVFVIKNIVNTTL